MKYVEKYKLFIDSDCNVYSTDRNGRINGFNNNPDNLHWATRQEQQANRAVSKQCKQKYGVRTCEDRRAYNRAYYASNPQFRERVKANAKKWRDAHPGYDSKYKRTMRQVA